MVTKKTASQSSGPFLARLVELYGVQTRYRDALGHVRTPSRDSLFKTLLALGADVDGRGGLEGALHRREEELWNRVLDPVIVAWEGILPAMTLRLPAARALGRARLALDLEDGSSVEGETDLLGARTTGFAVQVAGREFASVVLTAKQLQRGLAGAVGPLPWGRHRLRVEVAEVTGEAWVIAAPRRCWEADLAGAEDRRRRGSGERGWGGSGPDSGGADHGSGAAAQRGARYESVLAAAVAALDGKPWGLFAPVYALRSRHDWGAGDLAELRALLRWTGDVGGSLVATLPLLASAFGEDADPSPYRPISRLFWNEFFLSPEDTVEWGVCQSEHPDWEWGGRLRAELRASDHVDYEAVMGLKRPILENLARCFFQGADARRRRDFEDYLQADPNAGRYAAFRAAGDAGEERYHLYCQWQMDRQLAALTGCGGPGLLFDLPLGVHPGGFDAQEWPGLFASGISAGAPPDRFFAAGQDWSAPPLHPDTDRQQGYVYLTACLRNLMRHAATVRIDHMMSFHRLFWIPQGTDPKDGVYVTYPAEELYAVLSCESHRHKASVVGEDLGTVPPGVRASMRRHAVARTSIYLGALRPYAKTLEPELPAGALATLDTHDMVPLAGFLQGDDIETRVATGQLDRAGARSELAARRRLVARLADRSAVQADDLEAAAPAILAGCLAALADSAAKMVLVNLEDLLLERRPQNVPGTGVGRQNWRRKMAVSLEELPGYTKASR